MANPAGRTSLCSIVFIDIVGFSKVTDATQLAMKARLNSAIAAAVAKGADSERVILDTGDGAALCFLADPEDALFAATAISAAIKGKRGKGAHKLRIGIHLGPVKLVTDLNGHTNLVGDGINVAQRIMSFAEDGEIAVSRAYYEVVARLRDQNQNLFHYVGTKTDKHVREHQVYAVNDGTHVAKSAPTSPPPRRQARPAEPVDGGADVSPAPSTLPAELVTAARRRLTAVIGPIGKVVTDRAASAAVSPDEFHELVAAAILDPARRRAFLAETRSHGVDAAPSSGAAGTADNSKPAPPKSALTAEELATARQRLARYVGPLATLLVGSVAKVATDRQDLYRRLSESIARGPDKAEFLAAASVGD